VTVPKPIKRIGFTIPISQEMARAMLDGMDAARRAQERWEAMTPAERAEAERERQAQVARMAAAVAGLHREALAGLGGKLREVVELHGPEGSVYPSCRGCDFGGYEGEAPEWPCRTYTLVTGLTQQRVSEVRKAARGAS
jgi:hypothetical protein